MHATDFSPAASAAFKRAVAMAKAERVHLAVLRVLLTPSLALPGEGHVSPRLHEDLGTGLVKVFLGSVAARPVAGAPGPVLTVRGR